MTTADLQRVITNVLLDAASTNGPIPRSTIYMQVGMNMRIANGLQAMMVEQGWIKVTAETIVATPAGRKLVADCKAEAAAS